MKLFTKMKKKKDIKHSDIKNIQSNIENEQSDIKSK